MSSEEFMSQTEKLISAMSWPKMSVSGLVQCTGGYLGTGSSLGCTKKNIFLVENHKINIFQILTKNIFIYFHI